MNVGAGGPPTRKSQAPPVNWEPLLDVAQAAPGEWFNMPIPDGLTPGNTGGSLTFAVFKRVAEYAVRDGVVYLRFTTEGLT